MGSGAMIYIPSFIETGSSIQKLIEEVHGHRQHGDRISLLPIFQNKESSIIKVEGVVLKIWVYISFKYSFDIVHAFLLLVSSVTDTHLLFQG
jgi:hypothetical protein